MLSDLLKHAGDRTEGGRLLEKPIGICLRQLYWVKNCFATVIAKQFSLHGLSMFKLCHKAV